MNQRLCTECGELKSYSHYHNHIRGKDGKASMCKVCFNARQKELRKQKLVRLLNEAYEQGVSDQYEGIANKHSRDDYVTEVINNEQVRS